MEHMKDGNVVPFNFFFYSNRDNVFVFRPTPMIRGFFLLCICDGLFVILWFVSLITYGCVSYKDKKIISRIMNAISYVSLKNNDYSWENVL